MSSLELNPSFVSENLSLCGGVVVLEGEILFEIFSVVVLLSENISLWEGVSILE